MMDAAALTTASGYLETIDTMAIDWPVFPVLLFLFRLTEV